MDSQERCTEKTVLVVMPMPVGKEWAWLADCNVLAASDRLDAAGLERVISEVQDAWRSLFLHRESRLVSVPPPAA